MRRLLGCAALGAVLVLAACSAPERTPVIPGPSTTSAPGSASAATGCPPVATASYRPISASPGAMPKGSLESTIASRGYLVVGVSSDTRLLGARDLSSNEFQGLDIEMAKQVAKAVFGSATDTNLRFRAISAAQRVPLLQSGGVDLVARAMTMTCERWSQVAFAGPYFTSYLKLLVRSDEKAGSLAALGKEATPGTKKKVCATAGSTTLAKVDSVPGIQGVPVALTTDCMVLWQQGQVDAIAADDAILAGLAVQDPNAKIIGEDSVESEPYGLAVSKDHPEFAAFLNGVLEQMRRDGAWRQAYTGSGLAAVLKDRNQPAGNYSRPLP